MILLVNQHTVPVFTDVVNAFATAGHETILFTGNIEAGRAPLNNRVKVATSIAYNRKSKTTRFISWMLFAGHYFLYLLFCKKPSRILVVTNPPIAPFFTAIVASLRNIPFHIVVFDLYPEALQQARLSSDASWIYKQWQANNRWTFARAAGLITLSESMKKAVVEYTTAEKVHIIFNWADTDYIRPVDRISNPFVAAHDLGDKFVVMYSGNMGLTHDLESLVEAASILRNEKGIMFVLIGEGAKRRKLENIRLQKDLDNVKFLPYQEAAMFPYAMAAADIGIVTLGTGGEGISVPSKTYVNMAAGLAIIAISPENSELNRIINQYSIGYCVLPNQAAELANCIQSLANDPEKLKMLKSGARLASSHFTSANAVQYVSLLFP